MKLILLLLVLVSSAWANSIDSRIVHIDGSQTNLQVDLKTEKTRLEWRDVSVPATCYRTVYQRRCSSTPPSCRTICRNRRCQRVCTPGRTICRNIPVRVPYRCMRTVRQQVRVHDYYVEHMVNLQLNIEPGSNMSESVKVTAVGDQLQVIQVDRGEYQIRVIKLDEREVMGPGVKHVEYDYQLDFN